MPIWECDLEFWSGYISCAFQPIPEADSVILMRFDPGKVQMLQCVASTLAVRKIQSSPWSFFCLIWHLCHGAGAKVANPTKVGFFPTEASIRLDRVPNSS